MASSVASRSCSASRATKSRRSTRFCVFVARVTSPGKSAGQSSSEMKRAVTHASATNFVGVVLRGVADASDRLRAVDDGDAAELEVSGLLPRSAARRLDHLLAQDGNPVVEVPE